MNKLDQEQQLVKRYLLHDLPENEREQFEERVITDPEFQEITALIEDELVDDYIGNRLSPDERERFRRYYLITTQHLEKFQIASLLSEKAQTEIPELIPIEANKTISRPPFILQWSRRALVAGAVGLVIFVGFFAWLGVWLAKDDRTALEKEIIELNRNKTGAADLTVKLTPVNRARQESQIIILKAGVKDVELELTPLPAKYNHCEFRLKVTGGPEIFAVPCLLPEPGNALTLRIPARVLPHQDYQLSLSGSRDAGPPEEIENYSFRVVLK